MSFGTDSEDSPMIWVGVFHLACFAIFIEMANRAPIKE